MSTDVAMPAAAAARDSLPRRRARAILLTLLLAAAIGAGVYVWLTRVAAYQISTDNAYVGGHQVQVAARLDGQVSAVLVDDMQWVEAGDLLLQLDDTDARIALQQAEANLAQAVRQVRQWRENAGLSAALAEVRAAELKQFTTELSSREALLARKLVAIETVDQLRTNTRIARSQYAAALSQAAADRARIDNLALDEHPLVLAARAGYLNAAMDLERTRITAPLAGIVAQRVINKGHQIATGQALMRLIPVEQIWVDANFKESQLRHLRIGQPVEITTVLYGNTDTFSGHITGVAPATGAVFALLPPQNASGNWVKVTQRVPVRIALDAEQIRRHPLQLGLSAAVSVNTRERSGNRLSRQSVVSVPELAPVAESAALTLASAAADQIIIRHSQAATGVAAR